MNIYELTAEYLHLQEVFENLDSTDEDYKALAELLEITENNIEEKAENYAKVIKNFEAGVTGLKAEEKRLAEKRKRLETSIETLKLNLYNAMIATGKRKFEKGVFKFAIQKNGGALPVVVDVPTDELPDEFVIVSEKPDLKAIAAYIEETGDITQFHFGERGESLRIK